jgi:hypothetical protein
VLLRERFEPKTVLFRSLESAQADERRLKDLMQAALAGKSWDELQAMRADDRALGNENGMLGFGSSLHRG